MIVGDGRRAGRRPPRAPPRRCRAAARRLELGHEQSVASPPGTRSRQAPDCASSRSRSTASGTSPARPRARRRGRLPVAAATRRDASNAKLSSTRRVHRAVAIVEQLPGEVRPAGQRAADAGRRQQGGDGDPIERHRASFPGSVQRAQPMIRLRLARSRRCRSPRGPAAALAATSRKPLAPSASLHAGSSRTWRGSVASTGPSLDKVTVHRSERSAGTSPALSRTAGSSPVDHRPPCLQAPGAASRRRSAAGTRRCRPGRPAHRRAWRAGTQHRLGRGAQQLAVRAPARRGISPSTLASRPSGSPGHTHVVGGKRHPERPVDAPGEVVDPALGPVRIEQAAARIVHGMDLQHHLVEVAGQPLELRRRHPGRQRGDRELEGRRQPRSQRGEEAGVGRKLGGRAVIVDLDAGKRARHRLEARHDLVEQSPVSAPRRAGRRSGSRRSPAFAWPGRPAREC